MIHQSFTHPPIYHSLTPSLPHSPSPSLIFSLTHSLPTTLPSNSNPHSQPFLTTITTLAPPPHPPSPSLSKKLWPMRCKTLLMMRPSHPLSQSFLTLPPPPPHKQKAKKMIHQKLMKVMKLNLKKKILISKLILIQ